MYMISAFAYFDLTQLLISSPADRSFAYLPIFYHRILFSRQLLL